MKFLNFNICSHLLCPVIPNLVVFIRAVFCSVYLVAQLASASSRSYVMFQVWLIFDVLPPLCQW